MIVKGSQSKQVMQKRIPTIVGLLVLLGALISGLLFFSDGTGVFAPRATAQTTPKSIRITNVKDNSFTVSFYTEKKTPGFVKYGTDVLKLTSQVSDDRDQLSGTVGEFNLHHITVRGLSSATEYFFVLGTESKTEYDNEGQPFAISTAPKISSQMPDAITVYGSVSNEGGTPAEGAIVYISADDMGDLSSLVKGSGSWAVPLSQALTKDGSDYSRLEASDQLSLLIQGLSLSAKVQHQVAVEDAQPVVELSFGQSVDPIDTDEIDDDTTQDEEEVAEQAEIEADDTATISGRLQELIDGEDPLPTESSASAELILGESPLDEPVFTTTNPVIKGLVVPNVEVRISVHSETQYETTLTSANDGSFELDLQSLGLDLEPGEHTITYSYIDPNTGQEVTTTETFWVEDPNMVLLAQANPGSTGTTTTNPTSTPTPTPTLAPYGTGSPYPINTPTPTIIPATSSTTATPATAPARQQPVGTEGALAQAGSIGATLLVTLAGFFFVTMGLWSWWLASELGKNDE